MNQLATGSDDTAVALVFAALLSIPELSTEQRDEIESIRHELALTYNRLVKPDVAIAKTKDLYIAEANRALKQARAIAAKRN